MLAVFSPDMTASYTETAAFRSDGASAQRTSVDAKTPQSATVANASSAVKTLSHQNLTFRLALSANPLATSRRALFRVAFIDFSLSFSAARKGR
jgi:hypothetical protein